MSNTNLILVACTFLTCIYITGSTRILGVFHVPSYSHNILSNKLMSELALKGHEVTVISAFPQKTPVKNLRDIELTGFAEAFDAERKNFFKHADANFLLAEVILNMIILNTTEEVLRHPNVQQLLKSNEKFDVVIIEDFVGHALRGIAYHFNAPCITFSTIGATRMINSQVGNPNIPSFMPDFSLHYSSKMSFFERLHNAFAYTFGEVFKHAVSLPLHNNILQKYFPGAPGVSELYYNVSLALVNAHVSTHQPVPYVPNMIDIGGFHVNPPKRLPKQLQDYLDNAKNGVIFFSMGSNLNSVDMPVEKREAILEAFSKLKQQVLWKWEDEALPGKPANVKISKWLPQSDILSHPNIRLFITHGGLLSQIEAVYHGVPIVGIPIYGDQKMNMANAVNNELGLGVPYAELTEPELFSTIQEVLTNTMYRENAKRLSKIMHDQPMKPLDKAIFWIEYVIRHQGAPHLRTAALNLSLYQYLLLDVIIFVAGVVMAAILVLYVVIIKMCVRKSPKLTAKKKEQ